MTKFFKNVVASQNKKKTLRFISFPNISLTIFIKFLSITIPTFKLYLPFSLMIFNFLKPDILFIWSYPERLQVDAEKYDGVDGGSHFKWCIRHTLQNMCPTTNTCLKFLKWFKRAFFSITPPNACLWMMQ